jgi:3-deoxy-D-arabino-heptulosonate 7-phosphate (DAHP) synthase class II
MEFSGVCPNRKVFYPHQQISFHQEKATESLNGRLKKTPKLCFAKNISIFEHKLYRVAEGEVAGRLGVRSLSGERFWG